MAEMTREEVVKLARKFQGRNDGANLSFEDLSDLDLSDLDLSNFSFAYADLSGANLTGANLTGTDFSNARLSGVRWDGIVLEGLYRYRCLLIPTVDEWRTRFDYWEGTVDELQDLIDGYDWPGSEAEEVAYHLPLLQAWVDMCRVYIASHPHVIPELERIHGGTR